MVPSAHASEPRDAYLWALGSGTYAQSFPIRSSGLMKIVQLSGRIDYPASGAENARIRLYRYRKTAPFGTFNYTQITSLFDINAAFPWSWTMDESDKINAFTLDPVTDSLAVSNVYTAGATPTMRALRIDFILGPA